MHRLVPWTVLGGYLGAGKTTLVNRILQEVSGERVAVVVNDFGTVNVDADLIRAQHGDVLELVNGCICCDLSGGMGAVMDGLSSLAPLPEHVLVEVSGVGDPGPVAAWGDYPGFSRGGVMVCADTETIQDKAADRWVGDTVVAQLRSADLLLLTHTDLTGPGRTRDVTDWLRATVPGVPVTPTKGLDLLAILGLGGVDISQAAKPTTGHHAHHAASTLTGDVMIARVEAERRLTALPTSVVRAKGFIRLTDVPDRATLVQVVGRRHTLTDAGPWQADRPAGLVIITTPGTDPDAMVDLIARAWPELTKTS